MASVKKGINYKTSYKALRKLIVDKLDKEHVFSTKKERKQAIKSIMEETRSTFNNGIGAYLDSNIEKGVHSFSLTKNKEMKVKQKSTKKTKPIGALKSSKRVTAT